MAETPQPSYQSDILQELADIAATQQPPPLPEPGAPALGGEALYPPTLASDVETALSAMAARTRATSRRVVKFRPDAAPNNVGSFSGLPLYFALQNGNTVAAPEDDYAYDDADYGDNGQEEYDDADDDERPEGEEDEEEEPEEEDVDDGHRY